MPEEPTSTGPTKSWSNLREAGEDVKREAQRKEGITYSREGERKEHSPDKEGVKCIMICSV